MNFERLDLLKNKLDQFRPLPQTVIQNLHENMVLQWTYHSNAIEGNTLSLKETKVVLEGITIGGKTLREHFEAINHRDAILFVEELVQRKELLTEHDIKMIHHLVLKNIDQKNAGNDQNHLMHQFIKWYQNDAMTLHPIERAARVHGEFVKIHPFVDGNGRTSRLLMNLELMKFGFPATILTIDLRLQYYETLDIAHCTNNYEPFLNLISQVVERSFEPYWWALGINES